MSDSRRLTSEATGLESLDVPRVLSGGTKHHTASRNQALLDSLDLLAGIVTVRVEPVHVVHDDGNRDRLLAETGKHIIQSVSVKTDVVDWSSAVLTHRREIVESFLCQIGRAVVAGIASLQTQIIKVVVGGNQGTVDHRIQGVDNILEDRRTHHLSLVSWYTKSFPQENRVTDQDGSDHWVQKSGSHLFVPDTCLLLEGST